MIEGIQKPRIIVVRELRKNGRVCRHSKVSRAELVRSWNLTEFSESFTDIAFERLDQNDVATDPLWRGGLRKNLGESMFMTTFCGSPSSFEGLPSDR